MNGTIHSLVVFNDPAENASLDVYPFENDFAAVRPIPVKHAIRIRLKIEIRGGIGS